VGGSGQRLEGDFNGGDVDSVGGEGEHLQGRGGNSGD
jgi:hypothetical protein